MVRQAQASDFDFIKSLYFHPQINPYLLYEMAEEPHFQPIFDDLLAKNCIFIYEYEGQTAGMFKLYPLTYRTSHIGYLGGVAISPQYGGRGLGERMLLETLDLAKTQGYLRIELSVSIENTKAIKLYEKIGFEFEGRMRKYTFLKSENRFIDEQLMSYLF